MTSMTDYARHSPYSDPGKHAGLLDALPADARAIAEVARNVVVHYRASQIDFPDDRLQEVNLRWVEAMLGRDQERFGVALGEPRPVADRVVGCCRDFTLMTVAALRQHGIPARSRVGFARYLADDWNYDHVIAEYWDGERWVFVDAQLDPAGDWPFDPRDLPHLVGADPARRPLFETAAQVWTAYRRGEIDGEQYGVAPGVEGLRGGWFIHGYVLQELAHRQRDEMLLWDVWGGMAAELPDDLSLVDDVAALLLAADDGDEPSERELTARYAADPDLHPGDAVRCFSPVGPPVMVDLGAHPQG